MATQAAEVAGHTFAATAAKLKPKSVATRKKEHTPVADSTEPSQALCLQVSKNLQQQFDRENKQGWLIVFCGRGVTDARPALFRLPW
jgi:hypothetical protein